MSFTYDTEVALSTVAALINTAKDDLDPLTTPEGLDRFLEEQRFSGSRTRTDAELRSVRALRTELECIWFAEEDTAVGLVNAILRRANALPQLVRHDEWDWHFHATAPEAPLGERMATEAAMALADVIRGHELDRLRSCAADDCDGVVLDLTRNRSKRFCDTGNCANRTHVKAYRARKARSA
ncbi:CGNR zinc finger domain-containing protein [Arthrobacter sp. SX1312]|uniref:CGNR zinc finger domain-containing protein n=1 Tax=Arthrobacter sp. SX1312 TaxID=2058896 RepID=UPI000CE3D643|nr:CGNR zinc finger domain-containing protein [Arthrobacter sp. SX1312]